MRLEAAISGLLGSGVLEDPGLVTRMFSNVAPTHDGGATPTGPRVPDATRPCPGPRTTPAAPDVPPALDRDRLLAVLDDTERRLDPADPESRATCRVLGYGEVSAALTIDDLPGQVCKRMAGYRGQRLGRRLRRPRATSTSRSSPRRGSTWCPPRRSRCRGPTGHRSSTSSSRAGPPTLGHCLLRDRDDATLADGGPPGARSLWRVPRGDRDGPTGSRWPSTGSCRTGRSRAPHPAPTAPRRPGPPRRRDALRASPRRARDAPGSSARPVPPGHPRLLPLARSSPRPTWTTTSSRGRSALDLLGQLPQGGPADRLDTGHRRGQRLAGHRRRARPPPPDQTGPRSRATTARTPTSWRSTCGCAGWTGAMRTKVLRRATTSCCRARSPSAGSAGHPGPREAGWSEAGSSRVQVFVAGS